MSAFSDYSVGGSASATGSIGAPDKENYWPLSKCRKAYLDYITNKQQEILEQKDARRYYHCSQWTDAQIKALNKRKQPVVTFNRIARKLNGVVGLIERLKQDPKAFPRTPKHEQGAELATAVIRYVLDEQEWKAKSPDVALDATIDGYAGISIELTKGDTGDHEIGFAPVETDSFFYDPRSYRSDFSDARYMGEGKWLDVESAQELFPDKADDIATIASDDSELSTNPDREQKWFSFDGSKQLIRLVDIWYKHKGKWCWTFFTGSMILDQGESYLFDEKKQPLCRYIMFSCNVDHDGDRYGFVRNMKSAQDEYNSRRSRALFTANSRRLILTQGSVENVEDARREWARPDGVVVVNAKTAQEGAKADDSSFDFTGQLKLMENAIQELDNYGPNQALIGDMQNQSGRAIQLLQQAGMAELGPYILAYRGWKVRVYRALFNAAQRYWTAERWIRVTDDEGLAQFIQLNGVAVDPQTGMPVMVNALGSLDVDIIIDEGPDTINAQQDVYETLSQILPAVGADLPPQLKTAAVKVLIDSSALPYTAKKAFRDAAQQAEQQPPPPDPKMEAIKAKHEEAAAQMLIDREKAVMNAQLEKDKNDAATAAQMRQAEIDAQLAARKAETEAQLKRDVAAVDAEIEANRVNQQMELEARKHDANIARDHQKHTMATAMEHDRFNNENKRAEIQLEFDIGRENKKDAGNESKKTEKETNKQLGKAIESLAQALDKLSQPKQIVRDRAGNIVGAKPVERLSA